MSEKIRDCICVGPHDGQIPETEDELRMLIGKFCEFSELQSVPDEDDDVRVIMVPHVDWGRGARVYGSFSQTLKRIKTPDTILIFWC